MTSREGWRTCRFGSLTRIPTLSRRGYSHEDLPRPSEARFQGVVQKDFLPEQQAQRLFCSQNLRPRFEAPSLPTADRRFCELDWLVDDVGE